MEEYSDLEDINDLKKDKQRKIKSLKRSEESIQELLVRHLRNKYPDVIFRCAPENIRLSIGQVVKYKKLGMIQRSLPDLSIYHPNGIYAALFVELKKDDFRLRKADGSLYKNEHVFEQLSTLNKLKEKGYAVSFGVGYLHSVSLIDDYMSGKNIDNLVVL